MSKRIGMPLMLLGTAAVVVVAVAWVASGWRVRSARPGGHAKQRVFNAEAWGYSLVLKCGDLTATDDDCASPPWGEDCEFARRWSPATSLRLWRGKEEIEVPRSVFADLSNINHVAISRREGGCVVVIQGGDAGEAWNAQVDVRGNQVVSRDVESGEMPEYYNERTQYVNREPPD